MINYMRCLALLVAIAPIVFTTALAQPQVPTVNFLIDDFNAGPRPPGCPLFYSPQRTPASGNVLSGEHQIAALGDNGNILVSRATQGSPASWFHISNRNVNRNVINFIPPLSGDISNQCTDMNDDGFVCGSSFPSGGGSTGFGWHPDFPFTSTIPSGCTEGSSFLSDLNNANQGVGVSTDGTTNNIVVVITTDDTNPPVSPTLPSGYILDSRVSPKINDAGEMVFVGIGPDGYQVFLSDNGATPVPVGPAVPFSLTGSTIVEPCISEDGSVTVKSSREDAPGQFPVVTVTHYSPDDLLSGLLVLDNNTFPLSENPTISSPVVGPDGQFAIVVYLGDSAPQPITIAPATTTRLAPGTATFMPSPSRASSIPLWMQMAVFYSATEARPAATPRCISGIPAMGLPAPLTRFPSLSRPPTIFDPERSTPPASSAPG